MAAQTWSLEAEEDMMFLSWIWSEKILETRKKTLKKCRGLSHIVWEDERGSLTAEVT